METAEQIREFTHACVLMHTLLHDSRPLTSLEYKLLETHLQRLVAELALKKSIQTREHEQSAMAVG